MDTRDPKQTTDDFEEIRARMRELAAVRIGDNVLFQRTPDQVLPAIVLAVHGELVDLEVFGIPRETPERYPKRVVEGTDMGRWRFP